MGRGKRSAGKASQGAGFPSAVKDNSHFVFCAFTGDPDLGFVGPTVVYISLRKTWEERGCLDDGYWDRDADRRVELTERLGLGELLESTYECECAPEEIRALLEAEGDFAYNQAFEDFLRR